MSAKSFNNVQELKDGIDEYLASCITDERPLTMSGLCVHLKITRETLSVYARGEYDDNINNDNDSYSDTIKRVKLQVEMDKNEGLLTGKYNPAGAIFDLKNNHGWRDRIEANVATTDITQEQWLDSLK